jgi:hypothetical protein
MIDSRNPLVDSVTLDDTIMNVRQVLAVLATASAADSSVVCERAAAGSVLLLQMVDDALAEVERMRKPWARPDALVPGQEV